MRIDNQVFTVIGTNAYECGVTGWTTDWTEIPVYIKFTNANTLANPTLDINESGAYGLVINSQPIPVGGIQANSILQIIFDGTYFQIISQLNSFDNSIATLLPTTIQGALQKLGGYVYLETIGGITAPGIYGLTFTSSDLYVPLIFSIDANGVTNFEPLSNVTIVGNQLIIVNIGVGVTPKTYYVHYQTLQ